MVVAMPGLGYAAINDDDSVVNKMLHAAGLMCCKTTTARAELK
jgi:hypothetical protein